MKMTALDYKIAFSIIESYPDEPKFKVSVLWETDDNIKIELEIPVWLSDEDEFGGWSCEIYEEDVEIFVYNAITNEDVDDYEINIHWDEITRFIKSEATERFNDND